jgi:hypothetical protein
MIDPELKVLHTGRRAHQFGWPRSIVTWFRLQPTIRQRMEGDSLISDLGFRGYRRTVTSDSRHDTPHVLPAQRLCPMKPQHAERNPPGLSRKACAIDPILATYSSGLGVKTVGFGFC